ncbi:hypothetical protein EHQ61_14870 [Leptospira wolffii]|nr:hypothetical protein EHQ61_14870 [Leptospira wolffii]
MGFATFASVTSFAGQTRAVANVGAPWSLAAIVLSHILVKIEIPIVLSRLVSILHLNFVS